MNRASIALAALASVCAGATAHAAVTLGPAVTPRGPGRVTVTWEESSPAPVQLTITSPGRAPRVVASAPGRGVRRVDVDGLVAGAEYHYEVSGARGRFVAPPDAAHDVRFVVFGDARSGDDVHRRIVERVAAQRPDFYLTTGDVVPDGDDMQGWRTFFEIERPLMATTPFATVRGNHDGHDALFERLVSLRTDAPGATLTYASVDVGPAHFLLLDTEESVAPGSPQYRFAERDLAAHRDRPLFVALHKPLFSTGRHGGSRGVHDALAPLFQRYGVDVVFQGHDHHYERTAPINGVTYVVTGGAGAILFGAAGGAWTRVKESSHHYLVVDATATRIRVTARRLDDTVLDAFELDPRRNAAGQFAAATTLPAPGGGGCAMLLFGRGRGAGEDVRGAAGAVGPLAALALVRAGARRRARRRREGHAA